VISPGIETTRSPVLNRVAPAPRSITSQQNSCPNTVSAPLRMALTPPERSDASIIAS